ncbi:MAG: hypothetical protein WAL50_08875 [Kineosporiaceae bacterium]
MSGVAEPAESGAPAWSARALLPADHRAPRAARRVVSTLLLAWGYRSQVELVELVASELVSTAVRRAGPGELLELDLWTDPRLVWLSVTDGSSEPPPAPGTPDPALRLIERVCEDWGVEESVLGHRVWAAIPALDLPVGEPTPGPDT